jgi:hypothetical protein
MQWNFDLVEVNEKSEQRTVAIEKMLRSRNETEKLQELDQEEEREGIA